MSVVYCPEHGHIDTDYNAEHFIYGTEDCAESEQE